MTPTNDNLGILNQLIASQGRLAAELHEDRKAIGGLTGAVSHLADEIRSERTARMQADRDARSASEASDAKINARIDRMAALVARKVVIRWLPAAGALGAAAAWLIKEGPSIIVAWWGLANALTAIGD